MFIHLNKSNKHFEAFGVFIAYPNVVDEEFER